MDLGTNQSKCKQRMAANQVDMNNKLYKNCPEPVLNVVPEEYTKLLFTDITVGENYEDKAIIGRISHLYQLTKRADGEDMRKILITDALDNSEDNEKKLPVVLLGNFAAASESVNIESYIILNNFKVTKNPRRNWDVDQPLLVLVKRNESVVWFCKKVEKKAATPKQPKRQKVSDDKEPHKQSRRQKVPDDKEPHKQTKRQKVPEDKRSQKQSVRQEVSDDEESHAVSVVHYEYSKLGDLTESENYCNVYGIVDKCDLKIAQGKKLHILELLLTDETEASFSCSVYAGEEEKFPDVYPGDVVRIHRMQVRKFRNKLKGKCYNPKFILIFSKQNDGDKPRTVAKTFTFEAEDLFRAKQLLQWNKTKNDPKLICDVQKNDFVNMICQVIGVYVAKTEAVILKIWDGTKANGFPGVHLGFKEERLDQRLFTIARSYYVNLFVYGHHIGPAAELQPGNYIEVRDAHLHTSSFNPEEAKLTLHAGNKEGRGIFVLNEDDERVLLLKERLEKIISDVLEFGNTTDDLLSQNNSMFLNYDISVFNSQSLVNRDNAEVASNVENAVPSEENPENNGEHSGNEVNNDISAQNGNNEETSTDVDLLNRPLNQNNISQDKTVTSIVDVSIKPGQSTQEFGVGMQRSEAVASDDENRMSVASEPDPICNLTPLQTRYFFHDPQRSSNQMTDSIFPTYVSNSSDDEWWNTTPTVSITDHSDIKPTRLDKVRQHDVPFRFRVLAAAFHFKPNTSSIEKFVNLCCPKCNYVSEIIPPLVPFETREGLPYFYCPACKIGEDDPEEWLVLEYTFMLSFLLHDGSACVEAYLWKESAIKFFKGITPQEALRDGATADSILHMLWNICPNCRPFNSTTLESSSIYPILDCCIFSYIAENETRYQIFDTVLT